MKKYFDNLHQRAAHEKRRIAMQASACITAVIFVIWISTLGVRLASGIQNGSVAGSDTAGLVAATAAAGSDIQNQFGQIQAGLQAIQGGTNGSSNTDVQMTNPSASLASSSAPAQVFEVTPTSEDYSPSSSQ